LINGYISGNNLSSTINNEKIKKDETELLKYIYSLKEDAKTYIKLRNNESSKLDFPKATRNDSARQIHSILEDVDKLGLQQIYPVILAFYNFGKKEKEYHKNSRSFKDFTKLWSFLVLAKYSKINPSSYEKLFANLCWGISKDGLKYEEFKKIVKTFFSKLKLKVESSKEKFIKELSDNYRYDEDQLIKTLLYDFYDYDGTFRLDKFEIEHILPQGKNGEGAFKEWLFIPQKDYEFLRKYLYKLGNLTLLERRLNKEVGDHIFEIKAKAYIKSKYVENEKISAYKVASTNDIVKLIEDRGKILSQNIFDTYLKKMEE
jgi:hypothetical protein